MHVNLFVIDIAVGQREQNILTKQKIFYSQQQVRNTTNGVSPTGMCLLLNLIFFSTIYKIPTEVFNFCSVQLKLRIFYHNRFNNNISISL